VGDGVVAWGRGGGDLRVHDAAVVAGGAKRLLRIERLADAGAIAGIERATSHVVARGAASDVSGGGTGGGFRARQLPRLSVALD
jgi:hypothetical protein